MSVMNIAGTQSVDDPEYRYKMPRLVAKIEGRGNGIKTVVVNCAEIALSLHRSTAEVCKFFGCELGAQSKYDDRADRAVVNGAFDAGLMQTHLSKYIEGFVLCPSCRLPETKYKFKGQLIYHKCYACGAVEPVDMNHKLTTFITKEHTAAKRSKTKGDKDDKKKKKKEKKDKTSVAGSDEPEKEDASSTASKEKKKKEKKDKKEKKPKKSKSSGPVEDEVEWHTDLSPEAVAARAAEAEAIEAAAQAAHAAAQEAEVVATIDNLEIDDENALDSAVTNLKSYIAAGEDDIFEELCRQQTYTALPVTDRMVIFFRAAFNENVLTENQIAKYSSILSKVIDGTHSQFQLIALCEHLCAVKYPQLKSSFPILLKLLYDEDLLEEECIVAWGTDERIKYAHWEVSSENAEQLGALLQPFIEWLENAEEESDEE